MADIEWDTPGVYPVLDGVWRIPLPLPNDGLRAVNVYVIDDGDGLVLIDGGWALAESQHQLERSLAELDFKLADIRKFLVTHIHRDHYSQAISVRRLVGSHVSLGLGEKPSLDLIMSPDRDAMHPFARRMIIAGAFDLNGASAMATVANAEERFDYEAPDTWLTPGLVELKSRSLEVVETPGHTAGHVVFYDLAAGVLFAGDHVLPRITPSIGLEPGAASLPLANYMDSLRLVRSRPDARLLSAHGAVAESVHARADELLAHHEKRLTESAAAVDHGASTGYEVAQQLLWTRREHRLLDMDIFNQSMAIGETVAHLDVCVMRGWLTSFDDERGTRHYQRA